ncbi:M28 family metallopeptidase, partial [Pseudomonas nitroreducens]|uniref:M28 family peptidase n=1 Tax=Pseudomonas nitroreducens TaxID=46680 RepID=UPI001FB7B69D
PGTDTSRALVVGAHLDSPNSPGGLDDGSGSVALLEAARVLDVAGVRPPVDTVFAWFGSHERGLYGSSVFANANAALLGR